MATQQQLDEIVNKLAEKSAFFKRLQQARNKARQQQNKSTDVSTAMGATGAGSIDFPKQTTRSSGGGGGSSGGSTPQATPADVPVRDTSKSNAETIAGRYRDRGYNARVVDQGGGKYAVYLTSGDTGRSPIQTEPGKTIKSMVGSTADKPKIQEEQEPSDKLPGYDYYRNTKWSTSYPVEVAHSVKKDNDVYEVVKLNTTGYFNKPNYTVFKNKEKIYDTIAVGTDPNSWINYVDRTFGSGEIQEQAILDKQKQDEERAQDFKDNPPVINVDALTYKIPGTDDKGYIQGSPKFDIPSNYPLMSEYDQGIVGGTARPEDLPWTYEGAQKKLSKGGTYNPTFDEIQEEASKNLEKWKDVGTSSEDMALTKKHYIGTDESGERQYISESPYQVKFGYTPNDPDYNIILNDINEKTNTIDETISTIRKNVGQAKDILPDLQSNLNLIQTGDPNATWQFNFDQANMQNQSPDMYKWIQTNVGFKSEYTPGEAEKIMQHFIDVNQSVADQENLISQLQSDKQSLQDTKFTVEKYKDLGYKVDIKDDQYSFSLPKSSEVHKKIFGDKEGIALTATAFIESPLAIKTVGSAIWQWATGDEKVGETRKEELTSYSLGLQESLQKGDYGGYVAKVGTSPAMVQGVYIPLIAYGGGYALTGLSAGGAGSTAVGTSTLAKIGSTTAGKLTTIGAKTAMIGAGAYGTITTAQSLYQTYQDRPEALPGQVAETAFTFGMAYAGFKGGQKAWTQRHTGSWKYNWKKGRTEWSPEEIRRIDVKGFQDVLEYQQGDKTMFTAEGVQDIGGRKVNIRLHGMGEKLPGKDISYSKGTGHMTWTEKGKWGAKITKTKFFDFEGAGREIRIFNLSDKYRAFSQVSRSMFRSGGEPTTGKGVSLVRDWGKVNIVDKGVTAETLPFELKGGAMKIEMPLPKKYTSIYSGSYQGEGSFGRQFQLGRTISFKIGGSAEGGTVGGSGGASRLDYSQIFGRVGQDAITMFAQDTSLTPVGSYTGIAGLGQTTETPTVTKTDTTKKADTTTVADQKISGSPGGVVLVSTPKVVETKQDQKTEPDYFRKTDVFTGSAPVTTTRTGQKVITTQLTDQAQDLQPGIMEKQIDFVGTDLGRENVLDTDTEIKPVTEITPGIGMGEIMDQKPLFEPGIDNAQIQRQQQSQATKTAQAQQLKLKQAQITETQPTLVTTTITDITTPKPITPKPVLPFDEKERAKRKITKKIKRRPRILTTGEGDKGLLSDLLSVTRSQARYGTATHPKLTKKVWKEGEKTLYMHVPTVEMRSKKKKKKPKIMRRQKDVLI